MRYYVTVGGRRMEVELAGERITVDGEACEAELVTVPGTPVRHLLVDGSSHVVVAEPGGGRGRWDVHLNGDRFEVEVVDERTSAIRAMTGGPAASTGPGPVRAPMPGLVVRVQVDEGQAVEAGQGVVIIEAMKMENELKAEAAGVVSRVHVADGQAVEKGTVLVEFAEGGVGA